MCGIAGLIDFSGKFNLNEELLKGMAEPLKYRGPDQEGYYISSQQNVQVGMAHKRLSIIDLSEKGRQPMLSNSGKSIIAFNGEIYNYRQIKDMLLKEGLSFKSETDTEVILNAYEFYGIDKTLDLIQGMFAFALFDLSNQTFFLVRDRFGEKPLYYTSLNGMLAFSSDIRSFKALNLKMEVDDYALEYYFKEMSTPIENTIYKSIKKVLPSHYIKFESARIQCKQYWELDYKNKIDITIPAAIAESERLFKASVDKRLVADVPVGVLLSGGIDSSLTAVFAAEYSTTKIDTFTLGFENEKYNEFKYAKQVANRINSNHHEIVLNHIDIGVVNELIGEFGEPFADSSMIPTYFISKYASNHVKVLLGGDGGDELFAGYETYKQGWRMQLWANNSWLKPLVQLSYRLTNAEKFKYLIGIYNKDISVIASALFRSMGFNKSEMNKLFIKSDILLNSMEKEYESVIEGALKYTNNIFDSLLYGSIRTRLVNDYFVKTDRASMFASIELRTPFVDRNLIEFCTKLPYGILMHQNQNKYLAKKMAEKYFPKEFVHRPKMGFGIPIGDWIKKEWRSEFYDVLLCRQNIIPLNYSYIEKLLDEHCNHLIDHSHKLWILYVFQKWILKQNL